MQYMHMYVNQYNQHQYYHYRHHSDGAPLNPPPWVSWAQNSTYLCSAFWLNRYEPDSSDTCTMRAALQLSMTSSMCILSCTASSHISDTTGADDDDDAAADDDDDDVWGRQSLMSEPPDLIRCSRAMAAPWRHHRNSSTCTYVSIHSGVQMRWDEAGECASPANRNSTSPPAYSFGPGNLLPAASDAMQTRHPQHSQSVSKKTK